MDERVREIENKDKLSPAGAGAWAELGNEHFYNALQLYLFH